MQRHAINGGTATGTRGGSGKSHCRASGRVLRHSIDLIVRPRSLQIH